MTPSQGLTKIVLPLLGVVVSSTKPKLLLSNDFLLELIKSLSLLKLGCDSFFLRLNSFLNNWFSLFNSSHIFFMSKCSLSRKVILSSKDFFSPFRVLTSLIKLHLKVFHSTCSCLISRKKGKGIFWKRTTSKLMKGFQNKFLFSSIFWATKELKRWDGLRIECAISWLGT